MTCSAMLLLLSLLVSIGALAVPLGTAGENKKAQTILRAGSQPSVKGPSEYFTGNVRIDPLFPANDSAPFSGAYVTFEPGARSAWHIHPTGQHLLVVAGVGRTQEWGQPDRICKKAHRAMMKWPAFLGTPPDETGLAFSET